MIIKDVKVKSGLPDHQLRTILQRFRQMHGLDLLAPRQISDRARQLQNAVIGSR